MDDYVVVDYGQVCMEVVEVYVFGVVGIDDYVVYLELVVVGWCVCLWFCEF